MEEIGMRIVSNLAFLIPQSVILTACIVYLVKKITVDGILLIIGSFIGILVSIFQLNVMPYLINQNVIDPMALMKILGPINFLASLGFSTGFFILIFNTLKFRKQIQ